MTDRTPDHTPDEARIVCSRTLDLVTDFLPPQAQSMLADAIALARTTQPLLSIASPPAVHAAQTLDAAGFDARAFVIGGAATAGIKQGTMPELIALNLSILLTGDLCGPVLFALAQAASFGYLLGSGELEAALAEYGGYTPPSPLDDLVMGNGDPIKHA